MLQEIDEIFKIFRTLGTPTEETWPGVHELPDFKDSFPQWAPRNLEEVHIAQSASLLKAPLSCCQKLATVCQQHRSHAKQ